MIKRKTVLAAALLILSVTAIVLSLPEKKSEERVDLADFKTEDIRSITLKNNSEEWTVINDNGWVVKDSEKTDEYAAGEIADRLLNFSGKQIGKEAADDKYGIANPSATVTYTKNDGESIVFRLGNKTPPGTEYYLADDEKNIYTIYTENGDAMKSRRYMAEDSFILGVDYESIDSIKVSGSEAFSLSKGQKSWKFICQDSTEEIPTEKVKSGVTRYLGGMYSLEVIPATDENKEKYGFNADSEIITVAACGKDDYYKIILGNETENGSYIMLWGENEIYRTINDYFKFIKSYREGVF